MSNCPRYKTRGWTFSVRPMKRASSTWNYRAEMMPPCRCGWPNTASACFASSENSRSRFYVGEAPLRMESELRGPRMWFQYRAVDIRDLDGDRLLESNEVGDNAIAILARL